MKRKFLLLTLMCLLGGLSSSLLAQKTVTIDGTVGGWDDNYTTDSPFNTNYKYNTTQQFYYADELGIGKSTITHVSFYVEKKLLSGVVSRNMKIYMVNTEEYKFSTKNPKLMSSNDCVFDGTVSFDAQQKWITIDLDTDFEYSGNNILLCTYDYTGDDPNKNTNFDAFEYSGKEENEDIITRGLYQRKSTAYDPELQSTTTASFTTNKYIPDIKFTYSTSGSTETPAPTAPTLSYPSNNQENVFNPFLRFTLDSNTTHYQILMGTDQNNMPALTDWVEKTTAEVDYQTEGLTYPETYYWRVVAKNDKNNDPKTKESDTWSFTTKEVTAAPDEIENATPNNEGIADSNPKLEWEFAENTEDYQVVLDGEIKVEWTNKGSSTKGSYQTSNLGAGTHTWQVNTRNSAGTKTGTEYYFTVIGAPGKVTPIFPLDGATGIAEATIKFRFAESTTHYKVFFATTDDPNPSHPYMFLKSLTEDWVATNGASEMEVNVPVTLTLNKKYYWTVEVKNGAGETEYFNYVDDLSKPKFDWMTGEIIGYEQKIEPQVDVYTFTSASVLAATNVAPENGANNLDHPTLSWKWNGEPSQYQVLLGTTNPPTDAIVDWTSDLATSYQTTNLDAASTYYWQVNIKDASDNIKKGDVWSFVTTLEAPVAQANPAQVVPSLGDYGTTTINWNTIQNVNVQGYNVYLGEEKLNAELIGKNTNYYEIPANSMKLNYNMNPGYDFFVEAVYGNGLGSVKSEAVNVKVTGTGYFAATIYKNDLYNRLEGATITLSCIKDEFGNEYEEGDSEQYEYATNSLGQAYYETITPDENVEQVTLIRIQNGTYNVTVSKANYDSYEGTITINKGTTTTLNKTLTADHTVIFDVTLFNETFNTIDVYLENANWEESGEVDSEGNPIPYNAEGYYHVYLKNGEDIEDLGTQWFQAPNNMTTSVYITYTDWANLGKGNYQFGVSKIDEEINWSDVEIRSYDVFDGLGNWSTVENWRDNEIPSEDANVYVLSSLTINEDEDITTGTVTIQGDGNITINGSLTANNVYDKTEAGALCINDGGQLRQNNQNLNGKFVMNIVKGDWSAENETTGWQFISSPIKNAPISQFIPAQGDYDLYKYNGAEDMEWINHKSHIEDFEEEFFSGRAYLASLEIAETVTLSGKLNAETTFARQLSYNADKELANFHLLGNPFTFDMDLKYVTWYNLVKGFAVVKADGNYEYRTTDNNGIIPVGDGFFVQATGTYPSISYNEVATEPATRGSEKANSINVIASGKAGKDNVVVNFAGQAEGFNKLQNFNDAIATVYVTENGKNYGIANVDENTTEVALNFNAKQMGSYTISLDVNGEFETVTLVDRFTGVETNMLLEDEYTFTATSNDNVNRFVIRLANGQQTTDNSQFVYQSGEELILSIEGSVQIVDMLGRVVYSNEHASGNNRINVGEFNDATYVVRVVNEEGVKVQKVVIY